MSIPTEVLPRTICVSGECILQALLFVAYRDDLSFYTYVHISLNGESF